jgi:hypothetical protein
MVTALVHIDDVVAFFHVLTILTILLFIADNCTRNSLDGSTE